MPNLFFHSLAASAGSGLTYIRNVVPCLAKVQNLSAVFLLRSGLPLDLDPARNITFVEIPDVPGATRRFWWEQNKVADLVKQHGADVLISAGNFAIRKSPVPQILLSGNSLYTSRDFRRDVLRRREYGLWLDNEIKSFFARRSVLWADCTVAPTEAFAQQLRRWTRQPEKVISIPHGFDRDVFFADSVPPLALAETMARTQGALRLLFVSHYNYYRNFETLFRALPLLKEMLPHREIKLLLTTKLQSKENPGSFRTESAARLVDTLGIRDTVVELGAVAYRHLHHLYRACDVYVTPAYTETFAHPLVEAMACGLPIVASDLLVHREVAGDAALFFPVYSPQHLAEQVVAIAQSQSTAERLSQAGLEQAKKFSWSAHVDALLALAQGLRSK